MAETPEKKFWQSTNFWISATMIVLGAVMGFSESIAEQLVSATFGVIAAILSVRNLLKDGRFDWRRWINDSNFWAHLTVVLLSIFPAIPEGLISAIENLIRAIFTGNFQAIIIAAVPLFNVLYKLFRPAIIKMIGAAPETS